MVTYIARRLLIAVPVIWGVATIVFLIMRVVPGDPAQLMLSSSGGNADQIATLRKSLGLDESIPQQYVEFMGHILQGNLGNSLRTNQPVTREIGNQLMSTLQLTGFSMLLATVIGLVLGMVSAFWQRTWIDSLTMSLAMLGVCTPSFWLGLMLVSIFSFTLHWFPATGTGGIDRLILPSITLALGSAAVIARLVRSSMIEALSQEYVVVARAKGMSELKVVLSHVTRNALIPAITLIGLEIGSLLGGAVVVESVFSRQGIGRLAVNAIVSKDYTIVQGVVLFVATAFVLVNIIVDLAYGFLDPRIRHS
ncbi:MAG TPA: ABC transporter permease [Thermomicrobiales bacterium]|nr:ABC transporter permease [Thermomicrobiales bacterium]